MSAVHLFDRMPYDKPGPQWCPVSEGKMGRLRLLLAWGYIGLDTNSVKHLRFLHSRQDKGNFVHCAIKMKSSISADQQAFPHRESLTYQRNFL